MKLYYYAAGAGALVGAYALYRWMTIPQDLRGLSSAERAYVQTWTQRGDLIRRGIDPDTNAAIPPAELAQRAAVEAEKRLQAAREAGISFAGFGTLEAVPRGSA